MMINVRSMNGTNGVLCHFWLELVKCRRLDQDQDCDLNLMGIRNICGHSGIRINPVT